MVKHINPGADTTITPVEIRPAVMRFAEHMEIVLRRNDHKKSWKNCNYEYLLQGIERETVELRNCFWKADDRSDLMMCNDLMPSRRFTEDQILSECADVANFAMMVFDNLHKNEAPTNTPVHLTPTGVCIYSKIWEDCPYNKESPAHPPEAQQRVDAAIRKIQCQSEIARDCGLQERYEGMQEAIALLQAGRK